MNLQPPPPTHAQKTTGLFYFVQKDKVSDITATGHTWPVHFGYMGELGESRDENFLRVSLVLLEMHFLFKTNRNTQDFLTRPLNSAVLKKTRKGCPTHRSVQYSVLRTKRPIRQRNLLLIPNSTFSRVLLGVAHKFRPLLIHWGFLA